MKFLTKKYPVLGSSQDPESLSLTVKGIGIALIPLIIACGRMANIDLVETDLVQIINAISTITAGVVFLIGIGRKLAKK